MKVATFYSPEDIRVVEQDIPEINEGEALLEVRACGICGTDLFKLKEGRKGEVLGHEVSGIIRKIKGESIFKEGERVSVAHHIPCFVCSFCRHGNFSLCPQFRQTNLFPGGFSQFLKVPFLNLKFGTLSLPPSLSFEEATLIEPFACAWRNIKRISPLPEDRVLIIGCGPAGLMHLLLLRMIGIVEIHTLDLVEWRREFSLTLGARKSLSPESTEKEYDVVIVAAGNVRAIQEGIRRVRRGGKLSIFAQVEKGEKITLDPNLIYYETTLCGTYSSTPIEQREILRFMEGGKLKGGVLITHTFPLSRIKEAFQLALKGGASCKIIVYPQK